MSIQQSIMSYERFLDDNSTKYQLCDKIVTEGVVDCHSTMSIQELDAIYKKAAMFYVEYELVQTLVSQMKGIDRSN